MHTPTGSFGGILNMGSKDPNCSFNREAVDMRAPKRRKNDGPHCALVPKDDFQEDGSGEILKDGYRWRRYDKTNIDETPDHCRSYMCTNPRCSMKIHLEKVSLFSEKLLITYVGVHTHCDHLPLPYMAPEANTPYVAVSNSGLTVQGQRFPTSQQFIIHEFIDFLKPAFGIFLREPSKMQFWSHANSNPMNPSLPQQSSDEGPNHASFPANNVVQSPLYANGFHNPQLAMQMQQVYNAAAFHSIDAEHEHPGRIQFESPVMARGEFMDTQYNYELVQQQQQEQQERVVEYDQSAADHLHINHENEQYFGIHDSDLGADVGDIISFHSYGKVLPNAETLQSLSIQDPNLRAATEDINLQYQSLIDSLQYNETLQSLKIYEDINLMQHMLLHEDQNVGNHTISLPLTCEQTSTFLVAGGGDIN